jgi:WhiB family transcriptional regulator, redox-sensing transcriptional regulator
MALEARADLAQSDDATTTRINAETSPESAVDWRDQALCSDETVRTSLFFPVGVTGSAAVQIEDAKEVCVTCPARQACLEYAITTNQEYGIWGGTSEEERRVLRRTWRAEQRALRQKQAAERKAAREAARLAAERARAAVAS